MSRTSICCLNLGSTFALRQNCNLGFVLNFQFSVRMFGLIFLRRSEAVSQPFGKTGVLKKRDEIEKEFLELNPDANNRQENHHINQVLIEGEVRVEGRAVLYPADIHGLNSVVCE